MPIQRRALVSLRIDRVAAKLTARPSLGAHGRPVPGKGKHLLSGRPEPDSLWLRGHGRFTSQRFEVFHFFELDVLLDFVRLPVPLIAATGSGIRRQVRVHTAHGRFTGWVLLALPAALAVALSFINPDHMNLLFHEHSGQMLLLAAAVMQFIGFIWIRQVIKIEV